MTVEYVVLGVILILMGAGQIYLRHFSGGEGAGAAGSRPSAGRGVRSGRVWEGWTAILGFVGVVMGIALVVLGLLGR